MSDRLTQAQQRLQEMAKDYQPLVSAQSVREQRAEIRARADACDLGAQCVALVQQVTQSNPWVKHESGSHQCAFCRTYRTERELSTMDSQFLHGSNCLWQHARQLTNGGE